MANRPIRGATGGLNAPVSTRTSHSATTAGQIVAARQGTTRPAIVARPLKTPTRAHVKE